MKSVRLKGMVIIGSISTIVFSIWYFFAPSVYEWSKYLNSLPAEIAEGFEMANFFFALSLLLFGLFTIFLIIWQGENAGLLRIWLLHMNVLWLVRVIFHLFHPANFQGSFDVQLIIYIFTAICFLIPLVFLNRKRAIFRERKFTIARR